MEKNKYTVLKDVSIKGEKRKENSRTNPIHYGYDISTFHFDGKIKITVTTGNDGNEFCLLESENLIAMEGSKEDPSQQDFNRIIDGIELMVQGLFCARLVRSNEIPDNTSQNTIGMADLHKIIEIAIESASNRCQ